MKDINEIAKLVKLNRKKQLLNQQQLAEKADVAVATIRDLERGKLKDIKLSTIKKLFSTLDLKITVKRSKKWLK